MIAAAHDLFATLTARLLRGMPDDKRHQTRRVISKLVIHFYSFASEWARNRARVDITLLLLSAPDETLASDCLAACDRAHREEQQHRELIAKFDGLAGSTAKLNEVLARLDDTMAAIPGGEDAQ